MYKKWMSLVLVILTTLAMSIPVQAAKVKLTLSEVTILNTGTAEIGDTLSAVVSPVGATANYQWQIADTENGTYKNINGSKSSTYTVSVKDYSKFIRVTATGSGSYSGNVISSPIAVSAASALTGVTIMGTAVVGATLVALVSPEGATASYQWQRANTTDGLYTNIPGAKSSTYAIGTADYNQFLRVTATGSSNYSGTVTSSPTEAVAGNVTGVTITGTAEVGATLAAVISPANATVNYQWQRAEVAEGPYADIAGATASNYIIETADNNQYLRVTAIGTSNFAGTVTSSPTAAVAARNVTGVSISGAAEIGATLTAVVSPTDATVSYQWQSSDAAEGPYTDNTGATASTYAIGTADYNQFLRVTATGSSNYSGTVTSSPTEAVAGNVTGVTITGTAEVGATLAAVISPANATVNYQWQRAEVAEGPYADIAGATASTYIIGTADNNQYFRVTAIGTGNFAGTVTSSPTAAVAARNVTGVSISGVAEIGATLTAVVSPTDATVSYQWQSSDVAVGSYTDITGATASTYAIGTADYNQFLRVTATGTGSFAGTITSSPTAVVAGNVTSVTITGTTEVGATLTAVVSPSEATVSYQWQIADTAEGPYIDIAGAAASTCTIAYAYLGDYIKVLVSGTGSFIGSVESLPTEKIKIPTLTFSPATVKAGSIYFDDVGSSKDEVDAVEIALWSEGSTFINTKSLGQIEIKQVFSSSGDGNLTINVDNITQGLLNWLEYVIYSSGRIAFEIEVSIDVQISEIINSSSGTQLIQLLRGYPDWEGTTVRVNFHDLVEGTNSGRIVLDDGIPINFEVVTIGNLTNVTSVTVTSTATTIDVDDGTLQMTAIVGPEDAYDKTVRWSVEPGDGEDTLSALISNMGADAGRLFAVKNGTVKVYATSADTGIRSDPFIVTITGQ